jgi:biopolymer transport protein ExbB
MPGGFGLTGLEDSLQGDAISRLVAVLLLLMSVASWVVILWKSWLLQRAVRDVGRSTAAFWQSASMADAGQRVPAFDRHALVWPLIAATHLTPGGTLANAGDRSQQLTRVLRDALHQVLHKLQFGQILLATVGATSPFVGLLGTVWGIYHALIGMAGAGQITIDRIAGPVGEALIMTAAGLAVAIPAVLAYNVLGHRISRLEADLEGFARDLRELLLSAPEDRA